MRYLNEQEIEPYINAGKIIEQYLGDFMLNELLCHRFISIGKSKKGYYCFLSEVFDDSKNGIESIYHYSNLDPDYPEGIEIGPMTTLADLLTEIKNKTVLSIDKYLLTGFLDKEKTQPDAK